MALSWNEIKSRAITFSKEWEDESRENAESQSFWNDFFDVFGVARKRVATFEKPVQKLGNKKGSIDLLWKGIILVEHKSRGKDLDKAYQQAKDYFPGIKDHELPRYILVSDFEIFKLYDLEENTHQEFHIDEFYKHIKLFGFMAGYTTHKLREEDPVNIKAAQLLGKLHDELKETGYVEHPLELFLVRLLFLMFAEDTAIFEKNSFVEYIENRTNEDGSDVGSKLTELFQVLNTPEDKRLKTRDESLSLFAYTNGKLFEEFLPIPAFDTIMRELLIECCYLDWSKISPAIFGSLFQSIMDKDARRNLGAHYTSEANILKLIKPLFLDELYERFEKVKKSKKKLQEFHKELSDLHFFDPACGSGNFLIIAYRELRKLELEILKVLHKESVLDIDAIMQIDVDQFYGIEIDEFAAQIAQVAMWLIDHQMNMLISQHFGQYYVRLPLKKSANIVHGNSLEIDWEEVVGRDKLSFILGNPPFIGHHLQTIKQKKEMKNILYDIKASGVMDYVSAWFYKASNYIQNTKIKVAFVSTNSISQGEQVGILWGKLLVKYKIKIHFAHQTFNWSNEASGNAAVHVVIVGFGNFDCDNKRIYEYEDIKGDAHEKSVKNINPYLVDAHDIVVTNRTKPLSNVPAMKYGNKPTDGGFYLLNDDEKELLIQKDIYAEKFIKPFLGGREFLRNINRWVIWLVDANPNDLKKSPEVLKRIEQVKQFRLNSKAKSTREYPYHTLFRQITQPENDFILVPRTTSENREYIPMGFFVKDYIVGDTCQAIPNGDLFLFGNLTSLMHMSWVKYTCGRLKSDYRYSKDLVYNNYPFPKDVSDKNRALVEEKAQAILDIRKSFPDSSLADLYDPLAMPPHLKKAHQELDKAVDNCYTKRTFKSEKERIEFLFGLYEEYVGKEK
jgi:type II restriction/modification system DNA methylase subunit YeeA